MTLHQIDLVRSVCVCVCACVRACGRAGGSVRACVCVCVCVCVNTSSITFDKCWSPYLGKATAAARAALPFLPVCAAFSCVQTMIRLSK